MSGFTEMKITKVREGDGLTYPLKGSRVRIHFDAFVIYKNISILFNSKIWLSLYETYFHKIVY